MHFDKSLILKLLREFEEGKEHYTHEFEKSASSFTGKANRPDLRKYLRYCESKGYILNYDKGTNIHKWSITQDGIDMLALLEKDCFIH